ncbi:MAG: ABC transporter permease [bacterium]|nr:ABC transporter permease [bacterium]
MSWNRIYALFLRQVYLYRHSLPRLMEITYWPLVDILLWGFLTLYLTSLRGSVPTFISFLLGALILWEMLFRAQQALSLAFLEDVWTRNLLNIFVAPVSSVEFLTAGMLLGLAKVLVAFIVMTVLAFMLYAFNIFTLGPLLLPFIGNLVVFGWAMGIITTAVILRYGQGAEALAWGIAFLIQPVSAVFYPVTVLPAVLQKIAFFLPSSHIFEGMRTVLSVRMLPGMDLFWAAVLNAIYLSLAILFFTRMFCIVKEKGRLTHLE